MIQFLQPIYTLVIMTVLILWQIYYYRFWGNFPHKPVYFVRLFTSVLFLLYVVAFLTFCIGEKYSLVSIKNLELIGLCTLVNIIVIFSLNCLELLLTFIIGLIKFKKNS